LIPKIEFEIPEKEIKRKTIKISTQKLNIKTKQNVIQNKTT
jgi:hypothetical protein